MVSAAELVVFDMDRNVAGRIQIENRQNRGTANRPKQTKDRKENTRNTRNTKKDEERTQS
jgi:hypothetical protein